MLAVLLSFVDKQKTKNIVGIEIFNNFLKISQLVSGVPRIPTLASGIAVLLHFPSRGLHVSALHEPGQATSAFCISASFSLKAELIRVRSQDCWRD